MYEEKFKQEIELRKDKIVTELKANDIDAILVVDNSNLYYTSGRVFSGYTYISQKGEEIFFVKKPVGLKGNNVVYIRKPEQIPSELLAMSVDMPQSIGLEYNTLSYSDIVRLQSIFPDAKFTNASNVLRKARAVKTPYEIEQIKESGIHHAAVYSRIPELYKDGMTDMQLQIELERELRKEGSIGIFRVSGQSMEIFMGSVLSGKNANSPSPYDFSMGGAGLDSSLPVGCNNSTISAGETIMVDMGGVFTGYMTDMTRTYYKGNINPIAIKAHQVSIDICSTLAERGKSGVAAKELYDIAMEIAKKENLEEYYMGYSQKAGFIGHGVGIEINESPVLAPRSKDILTVGNIIAIEPKFVIPEVGAVGIENTYLVTDTHLECLTNLPEQLIEL